MNDRCRPSRPIRRTIGHHDEMNDTCRPSLHVRRTIGHHDEVNISKAVHLCKGLHYFIVIIETLYIPTD